MSKDNFGLVGNVRDELVKRFRQRKPGSAAAAVPGGRSSPAYGEVPESFCRFDRLPGYERLMVPQAAAQRLGIENPFFKVHAGSAGATTEIGGRSYINFSSYNYLGLSGHPRVNKAAADAIARYGTSASASRLVAGERPIHAELERALAEFYEVDDCIVFVSGHATNVSTIGCLFGARDLVLHDALIHNSVIEGIKLSGATRRSFPHNDATALDGILEEIRGQFERVLIVIEGLYSMDGDVPHLPHFLEIKRRHKAFLMVDEAHALGVLGKTGRGIRELHGVAGKDVDIWMGTLSKTLAGCGGFIAGEHALVYHLKYAAAGFVYSVGVPPPIAAACLEALRLMLAEPERVARLQERSRLFLDTARSHGLNTGLAEGHAVIPAIMGSSLKATKAAQSLSMIGINVQPIIHPAVEERAARLRFFLSWLHSPSQIALAVEALAALA